MADKSNVPAKTAGGPLAAVMDYGTDAGAGYENQTTDDVSIPFIGVLQSNSPEIAGPPDKRIKGAVVGMLINTVTKELFDGEVGIIIQPCDTQHLFVEWKPRAKGGGFVAKYDIDSLVVAHCKNTQKFGEYVVNGDNELNETFYVAALFHRTDDIAEQAKNPPEPVLIAFTSTKIRAYKSIMTRLRTVKGNPPLFAHRLRLTTSTETNAQGTFSNFILKPVVNNEVVASQIPPALGDQPNPLLVQGRELMKAWRSGAKQANEAGQSQGGGGARGNDTPPF